MVIYKYHSSAKLKKYKCSLLVRCRADVFFSSQLRLLQYQGVGVDQHLSAVFGQVHTKLCTLCTVQCTLCTVQCTLYTLQCIFCTVQCTLCTVQCTLCTVQCTLCTVQCKLYTLQCIFALCIVHFALYSEH